MRKRVLDESKQKEILAILAVGCSQSMAAKYVGCSPQTIRNEAERNPKFAEQMRQAKGNMELGLIRNIRNAAKKEQYWRAAAWALERCFPERYARRGPDVITADQLAEILSQFADRIMQLMPDRDRKALVKDAQQIAQTFSHSLGKNKGAADDSP